MELVVHDCEVTTALMLAGYHISETRGDVVVLEGEIYQVMVDATISIG